MKALVIPISFKDKPHLIDVPKGKELQTYYTTMNCRVIDCVELHYDSTTHKAIDCIVDDEGVFDNKLNNYWARAYLFGLVPVPLFGTTIIVMSNLNNGESVEIDFDKVKSVLISEYGFTESDFDNCKGI